MTTYNDPVGEFDIECEMPEELVGEDE